MPSRISNQITSNTEGLAGRDQEREPNCLAKAAEPPPKAQLTFLKFAVEQGGTPAAATNRGRKKERLL
jgi:hypothetical protein